MPFRGNGGKIADGEAERRSRDVVHGHEVHRVVGQRKAQDPAHRRHRPCRPHTFPQLPGDDPPVGQVGHDAGDAHHVVIAVAYLLDESLQRGKVQQGARGLDVRLDQLQPPTAMKHPQ